MYQSQPLWVRQSKNEIVFLNVDSSDCSTSAWGAGGLDEGASAVTIKKTATGTYSIKPKRVPSRTPVVVGMPVPVGTVDGRFSITTLTAAEIIIVGEVSGTDTNMDFNMTVMYPYRKNAQ